MEQSKIEELVDASYALFCSRGIHDSKLSVERLLVFCICDVCDAVRAYARGCRSSDLGLFDDALRRRSLVYAYETYAGGTIGASFASCAIRIMDIMGYLDIVPVGCNVWEELFVTYGELFKNYGFYERCMSLCALLSKGDDAELDDDGTENCLPQVLNSSLCFLFAICDGMRIELLHHIELRMSYMRCVKTLE